MGCTSTCMKCVLNLFNVILGLSGLVLIVFGVSLLQSANVAEIYVIIAMGGINLVAAILGCCGICHENVCMTATYAVFILCSLIGQIYNKIRPAKTDDFKRIIRESLQKVWNSEIKTPGAMDSTQISLKCCGLDGPGDYLKIGRYVPPPSCFPEDTTNISNSYFTIGCIHATEDKVFTLSKYQTSSEWGVIAVTAVLAIFAIYLVFRFNNKNHRYRY
ncbi:23 kDa integral membrane protein [Stomoxys calcitrans]|uniref:Tetraspanin n=1 Tax=Stomoxys calcitrans TaxID=35570 RepID=A0A1I8Q386_STOCA|nr:23 kDa integral membrane protein [Stomoxys calcitrans]